MERHFKNWGYELWIVNNEKYCGKLIWVEKDKWSSGGAYHYHIEKEETFFVIDGTLKLDYVKGIGSSESFRRIILRKFTAFTIPQRMKHRFTATSQVCQFIEVSTTHKDEDSYRCKLNYKGLWEEIK